jgi:hypothetical protein
MQLRRSSSIAGALVLAVAGAASSGYARWTLTTAGPEEPQTAAEAITEVDPSFEPSAEPASRKSEILLPAEIERRLEVPGNPPKTELHGFSWAGRPVHPAAIMELSCCLADLLPTTTAIDLEGFTRSNGVCGCVVTEEDGGVCLRDEARCGSGYFFYRSLGRSSAGTYVLQTAANGGGSGIFERLLFVRLEKETLLVDTERRDRIVLRCVGEYFLGDRDDGSVRFDGNRVIIGKSRMREEEVTLTID